MARKTKICSLCKMEKPMSCFYRDNRSKTKTMSRCKECESKDDLKYKRSRAGKINQLYSSMKDRYKKNVNGYINEICTKDEFFELIKKSDFDLIYENWKNNNYEHKLSPSVDRINNKLGYTLENIQIITKSENSTKGNIENPIRKLKEGIEANKNPIILKNSKCILYFKSKTEAVRYLKTTYNTMIKYKNLNIKYKGWEIFDGEKN